MRGDLVSDHALFHVFAVGQAEVFFGGYIAQHGRAAPTGQRRADGAGDVVVAGGNVSNEWAEHIERCTVANVDLFLDVHVDLVHRDVARAFHHALRSLLERTRDATTENFQLGKLCCIAGVGDRAGRRPSPRLHVTSYCFMMSQRSSKLSYSGFCLR